MNFTEDFPRLTNRGLRLAFLKANKRYFDGKIPKDTQVAYGKAPGLMGYFSPSAGIVINRELRNRKMWASSVMTLLHEMVHAFQDRYPVRDRSKDRSHGKAFHREMLRLANEGAFKGQW
jgi:hypothetical protein